MTNCQPYDLIGDIHGHAAPLETLLRTLGYANAGTTWRHPARRRVIFLGDYVDRGPEIRRVLRTVRGMVEGGDALALMGNHEYNALLYHTPDGNGGFLRPHEPKNIHQHGATVAQYAGHPEEWTDHLDWFATLPLWLDLGDLRAVHATWDVDAIARHPERRVPGREWLLLSAQREREEWRFVDRILKGVEVALPGGFLFSDKDGTERRKLRVKWWLPGTSHSYRDLCLPFSESVPAVPLGESEALAWTAYPPDAPPVFFGHYWMPYEKSPRPQTPTVACLDYSVAKPGGALAAYRWDGERTLDERKFVWVPVEGL